MCAGSLIIDRADADHRGAHTMPPLVMEAFRAIEAWARENPQAAVAGFGSVRQAIMTEEKFRSPYALTTGAALIAFTPTGDQLRVRRFRHFRAGLTATNRGLDVPCTKP